MKAAAQKKQTRQEQPVDAKEAKIAKRNRICRHPTYHAVNANFAHRGNSYASHLCTAVGLLLRAALRKRQDGWLTRAQALEELALDCHPRTARRRLADLLTLSDHFGERSDGLVWLRKLFLGEAKRAEALAKWSAELDAKAMAMRAARGTSCHSPVLRRSKFDAPPLPESHSVGGAGGGQKSVEAYPAAITVGDRSRYITSDPPASDANLSGLADKSAGQDEAEPWPGDDASEEEKKAWFDRDNARVMAEAERRYAEPAPKAAVSMVKRARCGTPVLFLKLNYKPAQVAYEKFGLELELAGCAKVLAWKGEGDHGGAVVNACRQIRHGLWQSRQRAA